MPTIGISVSASNPVGAVLRGRRSITIPSAEAITPGGKRTAITTGTSHSRYLFSPDGAMRYAMAPFSVNSLL